MYMAPGPPPPPPPPDASLDLDLVPPAPALCTEHEARSQPPGLENVDAQRRAWAAHMRLKFSPAAMLDSEGNIVQDFFKPKCVLLVNEKRWGSSETELLYTGLEQCGVGQWRAIATSLLPGWDEQYMRIRAAKLLGSQSLARYAGWKGSREQVLQEYGRNKAIGECTGCWKHGMLVENDQGSVKSYFEQMDKLPPS